MHRQSERLELRVLGTRVCYEVDDPRLLCFRDSFRCAYSPPDAGLESGSRVTVRVSRQEWPPKDLPRTMPYWNLCADVYGDGPEAV